MYIGLLMSGESLLKNNIQKLDLDQASIVFDEKDESITALFRENRQVIRYQDIPPLIRNAFIAVEDKRFYEHTGIDYRSFIRAITTDILQMRKAEGGSTITQQLAKNMFLSNEKTITRKFKELGIAMALENQLTKDEIIEKYLNRIYFGGGAYGIQAASEHYFHQKDLNQLKIWQVATLAGIAKSPKYYSPVLYPDRSKERRGVVLQLMQDQGLITAADRSEAAIVDFKPNENGTDNPYLTVLDYVLDEAGNLYNIDDDSLLRGGFKIYTTINKRAQTQMETAFADATNFPKDMNGEIAQACMVILDQHDGGIKAMVGGRNAVARGLNRVLVPRQPGSSIKPIAVYGAAIEHGWNPYDQIVDEAATYGDYSPTNHDKTYLGKVNMIAAIKTSQNAAAVWLLNQIGVDKGYEFANRLGLNLSKDDRNLSMALGGLSNGVTPMQMVSAYSAFANNGVQNKPHLIKKIVDADGVEVASFVQETKTVMSSRTAYFVTRLMQAVVEPGGTGASASFRQPVSGKTGTTQVGIKGVTGGNRDIWFVGYTPQWTAAVWMGFDRTDAKHYLRAASSKTARLFGKVMSKALSTNKIGAFVKPADVPELAPENRNIQDLIATYDEAGNSITLHWSAVENAKSYKVFRSVNSQSPEQIAETEQTELTDFAVILGESYTYTVEPVDASGSEGAPSNAATVQAVQSDTNDGNQVVEPSPDANLLDPSADEPTPEPTQNVEELLQ